MTLEFVIFFASGLLLLSVVTSKIAIRFGIPVLVLFLLLGMAMGSEGFGGIEFDNPQLTQIVGILALIFILFSGGLHTKWESISPVAKEGFLLATVGVVLTSLTIGIFAQIAFGFTLAQGILLGATMASTDAAAVFSVLGAKSVQLSKSLKSILELESGSNDPIAIFLTLGMLQLIMNPDQSALVLIPLFIKQMSIGLLFAILSAYFIRFSINKIRLEYDGLYPVLSIASVLAVYGTTSVAGGNGFLAVYLVGLLLGRQSFIHKNSLASFHDGLAWLMQIIMFLVLGLQVFPSRLLTIAPEGLILAIGLIFLARPLGVFVSTIPTQLSIREKTFIAWVGLRGAASIILATFTQLAGIRLPLAIFEVVFFAVLVSVILQGTTITWLAKRLNLLESSEPDQTIADSPHIPTATISDYLITLKVSDNAKVVNKQILDLDLPDNVLVVAINRNFQVIIPRGSTIILPNDELLLITDDENKLFIEHLFTVAQA